MSTLLKVFGYIFAYMTIVGGGKLIIREGLHDYTIFALAITGGISWIFFWGSKKLKERKMRKQMSDNEIQQTINNQQNNQEQ